MPAALRPSNALLSLVLLFHACNDGSQDPDVDGDACGDECATTPGGTTTSGTTPDTLTSNTDTSTTSGTTTMGTTTADGTADTTAGPEPVCDCQQPDTIRDTFACDFESLAQWVPGCPEATPCDRVTVECMRPGQDLYDCMNQELVYDEAAIECVLQTLRDQVPARLELDGTTDMGIFSGQDMYVLHVMGPTAAISGCQNTDTGFIDLGNSEVVLGDPSHFEACLGLPTAAERYDCIWSGLSEGVALPMCI